MTFNSLVPQRIDCLTEETTEWLYLSVLDTKIVGISGYTVRPSNALKEKPRFSTFLSAKINKILTLRFDFFLGISELKVLRKC